LRQLPLKSTINNPSIANRQSSISIGNLQSPIGNDSAPPVSEKRLNR
jgi:hypothetical protein